MSRRVCWKGFWTGTVLLVQAAFLVFLASRAEAVESPAHEPLLTQDELLSDVDRGWIATHAPIRYGLPTVAWPPFDMLNPGPEHIGLTADYLTLLSKRLELPIEEIRYPSFSDALNALRKGRVDMIGSIARTPDREAFAVFTLPYIRSQPVVIARRDERGIHGLADLAGKTVAIEKGFASREFLAGIANIKFLEFNGTRDALEAVSLGNADAYVGSLISTTYLIDREAMSNLEVRGAAGMPISDIGFAVRRDLPELALLLDHGIASISEEEHAAIRKKWIPVSRLDVNWSAVLRIAVPVGCALLSIILVVLIWNNRLRLQVERRRVAERALANQLAIHRELIGTIPNPIYIKDNEARFLTCNPAYEAAFGTSSLDILGLAEFERPGVDVERGRELYQRDLELLRSKGRAFSADVIKFADGMMHDCLYWVHSFDVADGQRGGLVGVLVDISETKTLERQAQEAERRLREIADSVPGVVYQLRIAVDGGRGYTFISDAVKSLRGYSRDEAIADYRLLFNQVLEEDRPVIDKAMSSAAAASSLSVIEFRIRMPDGSIKWLQSGAVPVAADDGAIILNGYWIDVTHHHATEEALVLAKAQADAANEAKGTFLASMSHEIRTPMNAIIGMSHLALRTELTPRQHDYVTKIQASGEHLLGIINDILDFSKIEAGKLAVETVDFEFESVLDTVSTLISEKAAGKGLEFIFDIDAQILPSLKGDPLRLGQVLINLCNNAVKFTEKGEIILRARVAEVLPEGQLLHFEVRDTGIGLTEEQIGRLFQAFEQADSSTTRQFGGTGLGLAISKRLVELMGGEIGVRSEPGTGSTFWFTARFGTGSEALARLPLPDMRGRRALVVDDNEPSRIVLADLLAGLTFEVDQAGSGAAGIEMTEQAARAGRPYDIALVDWKMPGMDGIETGRRLRAIASDDGRPHLVMVTAYGREEAFRQAKDEIFATVLVKPVSPSTLLDVAAQIIGRPVEAPMRVTSAGPASKTADLGGVRVLLVEDNELNREVAIGLLDGTEAVIETAENGAVAVEKVQSRPYDIVLMDMQMPVMDGIEAVRLIRANEQFRKLPIVAMTANAMAVDRERCLAAGMNDHIGKPIDPEELLRVILRWTTGGDSAAIEGLGAHGLNGAGTELPAITGVDIRTGLARTGGKSTQYLSLLRRFADRHASNASELRAALEAQNAALAQRIAHTLKGLAATIGAGAVSDAAQLIELGLKNGETVDASIDTLAVRLTQVIDGIRAALATAPTAVNGPTVTRAECVDQLRRLKKLLESDDGDAVEFIKEITPGLAGVLAEQELTDLSGSVGEYDFAAALAALDGVCRRLSLELA